MANLLRWSVALVCASLPVAASAVTINFDEATAPYNFIDTSALTTRYADLGVVFGGHGAVLDNSIADFGITGLSGTNVVGYANAQQFKGSYRISATADTVRFSVPQTAFSIDVGSGLSPLTLDLKTFDAVGGLLAETSVTLGSALQTVSLGGGFSSVALSLVGARESDTFAIDNLTFTQGPAILPAPEPVAAGLLAAGIGGILGLRRRARA